MNIIEKRRAKAASSMKKVMTAKMLLGLEENQDAILKPTEALAFVDDGRAEDIDDFEHGFSLFKEQKKFVLNRRVKTDKGGNEYLYLNFIGAQGPEGVKMLLIGNIKQFILDFHSGKYIIDFTFEQLIEEAEAATDQSN